MGSYDHNSCQNPGCPHESHEGPVETVIVGIFITVCFFWFLIDYCKLGPVLYRIFLYGILLPAVLYVICLSTKAMYAPFSRSTWRWHLTGVASLILIYLFLGLGSYKSWQTYNNEPIDNGWFVTNAANVRAAPSMTCKIFDTADPGTQINFVEKIGEWIKINYDSGFAFMHTSLLRHDVTENYVYELSPWLLVGLISLILHLIMLIIVPVTKEIPKLQRPNIFIPMGNDTESVNLPDMEDLAEMVADRTVSKIKHDKELEGQMMELGKKVIQRKTCEGCGGSLGIVNGNYVCDYCGTHYGSTRNLRI
jgi:uncharacterized Zn-finger protein